MISVGVYAQDGAARDQVVEDLRAAGLRIVLFEDLDELVEALGRGDHQVAVVAESEPADAPPGQSSLPPRPRAKGGRRRVDVDVALARVLLRDGMSHAEVARRLNVSRRTLDRRLRGG